VPAASIRVAKAEMEVARRNRERDPLAWDAVQALNVVAQWYERSLVLFMRPGSSIAGAGLVVVSRLAGHPGLELTVSGPRMSTGTPILDRLFNEVLRDPEVAADVVAVATEGFEMPYGDNAVFAEQLSVSRSAMDKRRRLHDPAAETYVRSLLRSPAGGRFQRSPIGLGLEGVRSVHEPPSPPERFDETVAAIRESVHVLVDLGQQETKAGLDLVSIGEHQSSLLDDLLRLPRSVNPFGRMQIEHGSSDDRRFLNRVLAVPNIQPALLSNKRTLDRRSLKSRSFGSMAPVHLAPPPIELSELGIDILGPVERGFPGIDSDAFQLNQVERPFVSPLYL
jgi:hypothetical protein